MVRMFEKTLFALFLVITSSRVSSSIGHDLIAMEALRGSIGSNIIGWSGSNYCNWTGVICNEDDRVKHIIIPNKNLTGSIPASIRNIEYLRVLDVSENQLTGTFPRLGGLKLLERLLANNNNFTSISTQFFSSDLPTLISIDISHNPFASWGLFGAARELKHFLAADVNMVGNLDAFSRVNFPSLVKLDISYNHLTGIVPFEFTQLPQLKYLDLSKNSLSGVLPLFMANVTVRVEGNLMILTLASSSTGKMSVRVLVIVSVGTTVVLVLALGLVVFLYKRKLGVVQLDDSNTQSNALEDLEVPAMDRTGISIDVVRQATKNFSRENLIGTGGFSSVFRAEIDKKMVAVKKISRMRYGRVVDHEAIRSFEREVHVLTRVRHTNLVELIGYCWDAESMILIYEYMSEENLARYLFNWRDEGLQPLAWTSRLQIALDVARGVEYLHRFTNQSFVHRDLKPSNILLTNELHAKVGDFGMVRPLRDYNATSDTQPGGTAGYKAPEYALYEQISVKADVFSFGVILLELITGKKAVDRSIIESDPHLPTRFCNQVINKDKGGIVWDELEMVIDPTMVVSQDPNIVSSFLEISKLAISCCNKDPNLRPEMTHVVNIIGPLVKPWKPSEPLPQNLEPTADGIDWSIPLSEMVKCWERGEPSGQAGSSE